MNEIIDHNDGHPLEGLKPYQVEGVGVCSPPPVPAEEDSE